MFQLTDQPIESENLRSQLLSNDAGAFNAYEGWVRKHNEGKLVAELHYHGYTKLAPSIATEILAEASQRFSIQGAKIVHRIGQLKVGDIAVWVGVTAHHRSDTFLACRYIIDNVKYRLPIWKKEIYIDGSSAWIENHQCGCEEPTNINGIYKNIHQH